MTGAGALDRLVSQAAVALSEDVASPASLATSCWQASDRGGRPPAGHL